MLVTHTQCNKQPERFIASEVVLQPNRYRQCFQFAYLVVTMASLQVRASSMVTCQHKARARWTCPIRATLSRSASHVTCHAKLQEQGTHNVKESVASRRQLLHAVGAALLLQQAQQQAPAWADADIQQVFVAGATGNTGRRVVQQLRAKGYLVRAGVRDLKKAQELGLGLDKGVTLVQADVTKGPQSLAEAIGDSQAVISAIGGAGLLLSKAAAVDEQGAINLMDAAKAQGVQKFVMVSSLLTNAAAIGQKDNPSYKFLNFFGQVLDHKLAAEQYLRTSGLNYTIVRPGGLSNKPAGEVGNLIVRPEDTLLGLDTDPGRAISRDTVAAVCVEALGQDNSRNKVVEIVASPDAPELPVDTWFTI